MGNGFLASPADALAFTDRLKEGRRWEDDLADTFARQGIPVVPVAQAEADAKHPVMRVGDAVLRLPDLQVFIPGCVPLYVEAKAKLKGTFPGADAYGLNANKWGRRDRWDELRCLERRARCILAFYDPAHGWQVATVAKLIAVGVERSPCGAYWLIQRRHLTPLDRLFEHRPAMGLVVDGRAV